MKLFSSPKAICSLSQRSIPSGESFTFFSGHVVHIRALALLLANPEWDSKNFQSAMTSFQGSNEEKESCEYLYRLCRGWIYGERDEAFEALQNLFLTSPSQGIFGVMNQNKLIDCVRENWMNDSLYNPFTDQPLTTIEIRAIADGLFDLYYYNLFSGLRSWKPYSPNEFDALPENTKIKWVSALLQDMDRVPMSDEYAYWPNARLKAYTIAILAKNLVGVSDKNKISIAWRITACLISQNLAFEERNFAVLSLLQALPEKQQFSFAGFIKTKLSEFRLTDEQLIRIESGRESFIRENDSLLALVEAHIKSQFSQEACHEESTASLVLGTKSLGAFTWDEGIKITEGRTKNIKPQIEAEEEHSNTCIMS